LEREKVKREKVEKERVGIEGRVKNGKSRWMERWGGIVQF